MLFENLELNLNIYSSFQSSDELTGYKRILFLSSTSEKVEESLILLSSKNCDNSLL